MIAAVHVVPAAGVELDRESGRRATGIATAALRTVDAIAGPVDLVLVAVPAGRGWELAGELLEAGRRHALG
jgi:hypothetical protein